MMDEACFTQSSTILYTLPTTLRLSSASSLFHKSLFSVNEKSLFSFELSVGNLSAAFIGITYTFTKIMFILEERRREFGCGSVNGIFLLMRRFEIECCLFIPSTFRFSRTRWILSHLLTLKDDVDGGETSQLQREYNSPNS